MQLDIVITYYKTPELLQCCLTQLQKYDDPRIDKIIVVDNSRDNGWSLSWLPDASCFTKKVKVIQGYNSDLLSGEDFGVQRGLESSDKNWIFVLESDAWPTNQRWLDDWVGHCSDGVCMIGYDQRSHEIPPRRHRDSYMIGLYNKKAYMWLKQYLKKYTFPEFKYPFTQKEFNIKKNFLGPLTEFRPLTEDFPKAKKRQKVDGTAWYELFEWYYFAHRQLGQYRIVDIGGESKFLDFAGPHWYEYSRYGPSKNLTHWWAGTVMTKLFDEIIETDPLQIKLNGYYKARNINLWKKIVTTEERAKINNIVAWMVVRDEEDYIELAIESVLPFVKGIYILDTGSEDNTLKKIRDLNSSKIVLEERSFTTRKWWQHPDPKFTKWQEIDCRNYAMKRSKSIFDSEWLLQVDGDECWNQNFFKDFQTLDISQNIGSLIVNHLPILDNKHWACDSEFITTELCLTETNKVSNIKVVSPRKAILRTTFPYKFDNTRTSKDKRCNYHCFIDDLPGVKSMFMRGDYLLHLHYGYGPKQTMGRINGNTVALEHEYFQGWDKTGSGEKYKIISKTPAPTLLKNVKWSIKAKELLEYRETTVAHLNLGVNYLNSWVDSWAGPATLSTSSVKSRSNIYSLYGVDTSPFNALFKSIKAKGIEWEPPLRDLKFSWNTINKNYSMILAKETEQYEMETLIKATAKLLSLELNESYYFGPGTLETILDISKPSSQFRGPNFTYTIYITLRDSLQFEFLAGPRNQAINKDNIQTIKCPPHSILVVNPNTALYRLGIIPGEKKRADFLVARLGFIKYNEYIKQLYKKAKTMSQYDITTFPKELLERADI